MWSELSGPIADIPPARRELQREYLSRIGNALLKPAPASRADARGLLRAEAQALLARVQAASRSTAAGPETRAHLADAADTLGQALGARVQRGAL